VHGFVQIIFCAISWHSLYAFPAQSTFDVHGVPYVAVDVGVPPSSPSDPPAPLPLDDPEPPPDPDPFPELDPVA
jgi:hypothetical protein